MRRAIVGKIRQIMRSRYSGLIAAWLIMILVIPVNPSCNRQKDKTKEEQAVIELLNEESRLAIEGDIDSLLMLYVQDDKNARLSVTKSVSAMITGWDAIREHQMNLLKSNWMDWKEKQFSKENIWIKINGDNAWAVCDNIWRWREREHRKQFQNIQITICEKHRGRWEIAFQAFVRDPEHMDVIDVP
jgi:hypothetical protein